MKICFVRSNADGVGHYRASIPALALRERGHAVDICDGQQLKGAVNIGMFAGYDIVVAQKVKLPAFITHLQALPRGVRPKVVFETDDLVTDIPRDNPAWRDYAPHARGFEECIVLSDAAIVSTQELASKYAALNARCHVVPNFLDIPGHRDWDTLERRPDGRTVIGWLGGLHHVGDERPMALALREILLSHDNVVFAFCGNEHLGSVWKRRIGVRDEQWRFIHGRDFDGYQTVISQFDIAVAPLKQSEFNRCKSDLRLLEYGAWGVPYVASNIAPYRRFHRQSLGRGGYLSNPGSDWFECLDILIKSPEARERMGADLRHFVRSGRGSYSCGLAWEVAFTSILDGAIPDNTYFPPTIRRNTPCPCLSGSKYKNCCSPAWG